MGVKKAEDDCLQIDIAIPKCSLTHVILLLAYLIIVPLRQFGNSPPTTLI